MDTFYLKSTDPQKLSLEVTSDGIDPDLSTVTAITLEVTKPGSPDLDEEIWTTDITAQSAEQVLFEHPFLVTDLDRVGVYRVFVLLAIPGDPRRVDAPCFFRARYI